MWDMIISLPQSIKLKWKFHSRSGLKGTLLYWSISGHMCITVHPVCDQIYQKLIQNLILTCYIKQGYASKNWVEGISDEAYYPWESPKKPPCLSLSADFSSKVEIQSKIWPPLEAMPTASGWWYEKFETFLRN